MRSTQIEIESRGGEKKRIIKIRVSENVIPSKMSVESEELNDSDAPQFF